MKTSLFVAVALAALNLPISAQEVASGGFGERMTVTEIQVPVQVFADGEPVAGLTESDFEVYDNDLRRELSAFEVVDLTPGVGEAAARESEVSADAHRSLLVLFDLAFNHPRKLSRAVVGIERMMVEQLHARDRVAIATFDLSRGVTLHSGFTTDRAETKVALARLGQMITGKTIEVGPLGAVLARVHSGVPAAGPAGAVTALSRQLGATAALALDGVMPDFQSPAGTLARVGEAETFAIADGDYQSGGVVSGIAATSSEAVAGALAEDANQRSAIAMTRATTVAFAELVTLLRDVSGQRHFLYLSRGLPAIFGPPPFGVAEHPAVAPLMAKMFRAFKASGWKLQAIDITGVPDPFGGSTPGGDSPITVGFASDPLVNAAKGTGGDVYENFNDISGATKRVIEKTRVTYLLTFAVADPPDDGRFHKLEVRFRGGQGRGYRLVHREGYYNQRPVEDRTSLERRLDLAEEVLGDSVGGDFEARTVVTALAARRGEGAVAVWLEVPGAALARQRAHGTVSVRVEAYLLDDDERLADSRAGQFGLDLATVGPRLEAGELNIFLPLTAPPGEHRLRLRLIDEGSGESWLGTARVSVPAEFGASRLLAPIFPELASSGVVTRLVGGENGKSILNPFRFGGRELVPRATGTCRPGERLPVLVLLEGEELPGRVLSSRVFDDAGAEVAAGRLEWVAREARAADGLARTLGTFTCAGLAPGRYWLEVELGRVGDVKPKSSARSLFEVKGF